MEVTELVCQDCGNPFLLPFATEWEFPLNAAVGPCCSRWVCKGFALAIELDKVLDGKL